MSSPIKSVANAHKHLASPGPSRLRHAHAFKDDDDDDDDDSSDAVQPTKRRGSGGKIDPLSDSDVSSLSDEPDGSADEDDEEDDEMEEEEDGSAAEEDEEEEDEMGEDDDDDDEDEDEDHVVTTRRSSASGPSTPGSQKAPIKIRLRLSPETSRKNAKAREADGKAAKSSSSRRASGPRWKAADEKKGARPSRGAAVAGGKKRKVDEDSASDLEEDLSLAMSLPKTARQLAKEREDDEDGDSLVELPMMESSKKLKLTESEIALRKSEMARRRRNQNEKKLEDDKRETINRLLKKQVSKRSTRDKGKEGEGSDEELAGKEEGASAGAKGGAGKRDPKEPRLMFRSVQRIDAEGTVTSLVALPKLREVPTEAPAGDAAKKEGVEEGNAEEGTPVVENAAPAGPDPALPYHQAWAMAFESNAAGVAEGEAAKQTAVTAA